jgi:hypothetical protein
MTEHRQAERRFGDEEIAANRFKGKTGGIRGSLVVARDHYASSRMFDDDLRRTENMPRRDELHARILYRHRFAERSFADLACSLA